MKVFVNSIPKSGTNLLEKFVRLLGFSKSGKSVALSNILGRYHLIKSILHQAHLSGLSVPIGLEFPVSVSVNWLNKTLAIPENQYLSGHAAYSEQLDFMVKSNGLKAMQIYRDPRAVLVSWAKYVAEDINRWYPFHSFFKRMSLKERIRFLLHGGEINGLYYSSFREVLGRAGGWIESGNTFVVRFEDLVGSRGDGSDGRQRETMIGILEHIGHDYSEADLDQYQQELYGGTHTFRSGRIDSWKDVIDDGLHDEIITTLQRCEALTKLGYDGFQ
ncbi:hypothetical protein D6779_07375 [Candidatus Parcubacteria bacterium]|nr:MAG: hypothetical protein D6779_07375 [Candidatus Parcubacteria bacterium]